MLRPVALAGLVGSLAACGARTELVTPPLPDVPIVEDRGMAIVRGPFDNCAIGQACSGGTSCIPVDFTAGQPARLCTTTCLSAGSCPQRTPHSNLPPSCVIVGVGATMGQCLESCDTDAQCGQGTRCVALPAGPLPVCVPLAN